MKRIKLESSSINSVGYDHALNILEIEFQSGSVYQYFEVPLSVYEQLISASSKGKYFHKSIANEFTYQQTESYVGPNDFVERCKVHKPASAQDIQSLYRKLAFNFHPDRNSESENLMKIINNLHDERNYAALLKIAQKHKIF